MNPIAVDPDIKINMSLDEIIHLSNFQNNDQKKSRDLRAIKRRRRRGGRRNDSSVTDHSVPLLSSSGGLGIYVSKKSPLLSTENRRRIAQAISNKVLNLQLIQKTKKIIPAEYKLFKTSHGVERILVPVRNYPQNFLQNISRPRPLKRRGAASNSSMKTTRCDVGKKTANHNCSSTTINKNSISNNNISVNDGPPPLVAAPIYKPSPSFKPSPPVVKMELDESDDDVVILDPPNYKKLEVIDVECNMPVDVLDAKKLIVRTPGVTSKNGTQTLNDRFTLLTGNFQF